MAELGELGEASAALVVLKADLNYTNFQLCYFPIDIIDIRFGHNLAQI